MLLVMAVTDRLLRQTACRTPTFVHRLARSFGRSSILLFSAQWASCQCLTRMDLLYGPSQPTNAVAKVDRHLTVASSYQFGRTPGLWTCGGSLTIHRRLLSAPGEHLPASLRCRGQGSADQDSSPGPQNLSKTMFLLYPCRALSSPP